MTINFFHLVSKSIVIQCYHQKFLQAIPCLIWEAVIFLNTPIVELTIHGSFFLFRPYIEKFLV
jgi:hypothetical protein